MDSPVKKWGLLAIRVLLTVGFGMAGAMKLMGAEFAVGMFDALGFGQWFRFVTGALEVAGAVGLWIPALRFYAAGGLVLMMIGAVLSHVFILGPSAMPATMMGVLALILAYAYRPKAAS